MPCPQRALIAFLVLLLLPACGDSDSSGSASDTSTTDVAGDATAAGPDWSCLGNRMPRPPLGPTLDLSLRIIDASTGMGLQGVRIKGCADDDVGCATPLVDVMTDANGDVTPSVPVGTNGFVGYAEITKTGYVSLLGRANVPITRAPPLTPVTLFMTEEAALTTAATLVGTSLDATRGHVLALNWHCGQLPTSGVSLSAGSADSESTGYYVVEESGTVIPSASATETDPRGAAGVFNLPVGDVALSTVRASDGAAVATGAVEIRAGWVSGMVLIPTE